MKVLITGAAGFVGRRLAESLVRDGHQVRALVRDESKATALRSAGIEIYRGDLADEDSLRKAVDGAEVIQHLARPAPKGNPPKHVFVATNVTGTENLMRVALDKGVRHVVVVSSTAVFGRPSALPLTPESVSRPSTFHEETMLRREQLVQDLAREGRISAVVARTCLILGPNAEHIVGFFRRILAGRYRLFGEEDVYYQTVDVDDVVQGLRLCGDRQSSPGESYIIAGKDALRLSAFVRLVAKEGGIDFEPRHYPLAPFEAARAVLKAVYAPFGREPPLDLKVESFKRHRLHDISKSEQDLGFAPEFSQCDSIRRTLQWMRESGRL